MLRFNEKFHKFIWFIGGFAIGFTLISLGHAAIPNRGAPVSEIKGSKVNAPTFDDDYMRLNQEEGKYAENWQQQQRLKSATSNRSARTQGTKKKSQQH